MKKLISIQIFLMIITPVVMLVSCKTKEPSPKADDKMVLAKESITKWIDNNAKDYPQYKSVEFGDLTPRYERSDRTIQISDLIALEQAKSPVDQNKLDSLNALLENNRGLLMGYTIIHKYQTTNLAGETINHELLFFLDSSFRVASILDPESYDLSLDPKVLFKPEQQPADTLKK